MKNKNQDLIVKASGLIEDYNRIAYQISVVLQEVRKLPKDDIIDYIIEELEYIEVRI